MSNWPGKFVIGLTGNIATGKSVVRRMLEHLGAYTIDADALTHRAYAKGAPGYQQVVDNFGKWLVNKDGEIDRSKLGNLVFNNPEAMAQLEDIVHPLVRQATEMLIKRSIQPVIVIEAIKLLEGDLRNVCDSIWVTNAPEEVQVERLMRKRGMSRDQASERIHMQSAQSAKVAVANIVITNTGSYDALWKQVNAAWKEIVPGANVAEPETITIKQPAAQSSGEYAGKTRQTQKFRSHCRIDYPPEQRRTHHDRRRCDGRFRRKGIHAPCNLTKKLLGWQAGRWKILSHAQPIYSLKNMSTCKRRLNS